jgi:phosphoribosylformimino-5-aminoimidazole carboxamide ribotide isomerase
MINIIPAIDIIDGKAVRLSGGDFSKVTIYYNDPLEAAKKFESTGLKKLHMVDLEGARAGEAKNWKVLERIATKTSLHIDFGGGIATTDDVTRAFNAGASQVNAGTQPAKNKEEFLKWVKTFGSKKFLIGADVKDRSVMVKGWEEDSGITITDFITTYIAEGICEFFCTDVSKDGMMEGPAVELYRSLIEEFPDLQLIASGGVRTIADVQSVADAGCKGVIIGKAIYEGKISLKELEKYAH